LAAGKEGVKLRLNGVVLLVVLLFCIATASAKGIYFTYQGNVTKELYIGGELHFPKSIADRIKISGGVVLNSTNEEWIIRVTANTVVVEYIKLTNDSFSYGKRTYSAKNFPAELYKPVKPDEMRMALMQVNDNYAKLAKELASLKTAIKTVESKPTFGEELRGFLLYFPLMWVVYVAAGILGFFALLGWWYERD